MRRSALIATGLLAAAVLAGCGAEGVVSPTPQRCIPKNSCVASAPTITFPVVPAFKLKGNAASGKAVFLTNCGSCHTLAAAGTSGTFGPNLDTFTPKPYYQMVTAQVTIGGALEKGTMPSFKSTLSTQQIADVAAYVVTSTGGKAP